MRHPVQRLRRKPAVSPRHDERGDLPVVTILIVFLVSALITLLVTTVSSATTTLTATQSSANNTSAVELATSAADAFYGTLQAHPGELDTITAVNPTPPAWPWVGRWAQFAPDGQVGSCSSSIDDNCFLLKLSVASSGSTSAPIGPTAPSGQPQQSASLTVTAKVACRSDAKLCSTETITQHLRRRTFLDYLYFVNHNGLDPSVVKTVNGYNSASTITSTDTSWGHYPFDPNPDRAIYATNSLLYMSGNNATADVVTSQSLPVLPTTATPTQTVEYSTAPSGGGIFDLSVADNGNISFEGPNGSIRLHVAGTCSTCTAKGTYSGYSLDGQLSPTIAAATSDVYYNADVRYCRYRYDGKCVYSYKQENYEITPAQFSAGSTATLLTTHAPPFLVSPHGNTFYTTQLSTNYFQSFTTDVGYPLCTGVAAISAVSNTETACYKIPGDTSQTYMPMTITQSGTIYLADGNTVYEVDPSTGAVTDLTNILSTYYEDLGSTPTGIAVSPSTQDVYVLESNGSAWQLKPPGTYVPNPPEWSVVTNSLYEGISVTAGSGQVFVGQKEKDQFLGETHTGYAFYQPSPAPPASPTTFTPYFPPPVLDTPTVAGSDTTPILATRSGYVYYEVDGDIVLHAPNTCSTCSVGFIGYGGPVSLEAVVGNDAYVSLRQYECTFYNVYHECTQHQWVISDYKIGPAAFVGDAGQPPSSETTLPTDFSDYTVSQDGATIYHPGGCDGVEAVNAATGADEHCYYVPADSSGAGSLRNAVITVGPDGHIYVARPLVGAVNSSTNRQFGHQILRINPTTGNIEDIGMPDVEDNYYNSAIDELSVSPTSGDLYAEQWFYSPDYLSKLGFYTVMIPPHSSAPPTYHTVDPAYQGNPSTGDQITGPIHTNSGPIPVCGDPIFDGPVEVSGASSGQGWVDSSGAGCANSAPVFSNQAGGVTVGSPALPLPPSDSSLSQIAAAGDSPWSGQSGYSFSGNITVAVDGSTLTITDPSGQVHSGVPFPVTGVVYATGNVSISGTNDGQLTVAAGGDITVTNNLVYGCAGPGVTVVPSSCGDVTGLVAQGNIWIDEPALPTIPSLVGEADRTVDAAMLSLSNSVDATGPGGKIPTCPIETLTDSEASFCPTLTINWAMATNYRGIFGFYEGHTGNLVAGWHKDFVYDERLYNHEPPWFLSPLAGQWVRSSPVVVGS